MSLSITLTEMKAFNTVVPVITAPVTTEKDTVITITHHFGSNAIGNGLAVMAA